jgi:glutaconyl-CoA/methylmalonyl-CoA decarboxylase subunit gamma
MIKKLRVTVDGKSYDVTVEVPDDQQSTPAPAIAPLPPSNAPPASAPSPAPVVSTGPGDVPSPLAGRVTAIVVSPGQTVKEGDHLLTLEAMKMNTFVFAPKAGKVAQIKIAVGDAVDERQVLLRIE